MAAGWGGLAAIGGNGAGAYNAWASVATTTYSIGGVTGVQTGGGISADGGTYATGQQHSWSINGEFSVGAYGSFASGSSSSTGLIEQAPTDSACDHIHDAIVDGFTGVYGATGAILGGLAAGLPTAGFGAGAGAIVGGVIGGALGWASGEFTYHFVPLISDPNGDGRGLDGPLGCEGR